MELAIIFAVGWVMSHAFSEKRDEYSASQEAHREKYLKKVNSAHPSWGSARRERYLQNAARRNALGHFAYLLRHGWSSTFNDFGEGWKKAKGAHEEWKNTNPKGDKKPGAWTTFKAGWKNRWAKRPKSTGYYEARPELTPEPSPNPEPDPPKGTPSTDTQADQPKQRDAWLDDNQARDAKVYPWPSATTPSDNAEATNGAPVTTKTATSGEAHNLEDVRRNSAALAQSLQQLRNQAEQLLADTMRFASKDRESIAILQHNIEGLDNAIAGFGRMPASLNKHQTGEEYASTSHAVNDINALKSS